MHIIIGPHTVSKLAVYTSNICSIALTVDFVLRGRQQRQQTDRTKVKKLIERNNNGRTKSVGSKVSETKKRTNGRMKGNE